MISRWTCRLVLVGAVLGTIGCDRVTKHVAATTLAGAPGRALFIAGGASNWIDRVARDSVVDFLNVGIGSVRTGVFNVADVAIMIGAIVFALGQFRKRRNVPSASGGSNNMAR